MNRHTPGPWILDDSCQNQNRPTRSVRVKQFGQTELLSTVHYPDTYIGSNGGAIREANARLIAAAPELLDALEAALDLFSQLGRSGATVEKVKCAIALAKGEKS